MWTSQAGSNIKDCVNRTELCLYDVGNLPDMYENTNFFAHKETTKVISPEVELAHETNEIGHSHNTGKLLIQFSKQSQRE